MSWKTSIDPKSLARFIRRPVQIVRRGEWECWLWQGDHDYKGYGMFSMRYRRYRAHRISHEIFVGPIPPGLVIDHLCRTRDCVNPDHLEPVTSRENTLRGISKIAKHKRQTHCAHGHPYDEENTRIDAKGHRECKICRREWEKKKREHRKLARKKARLTSMSSSGN